MFVRLSINGSIHHYRDREIEYRIKGSKFLSFLIPCDAPKSADDNLDVIKTTHPSATLHCYAYRVDPGNCTEFSQDDGEPAEKQFLPY